MFTPLITLCLHVFHAFLNVHFHFYSYLCEKTINNNMFSAGREGEKGTF